MSFITQAPGAKKSGLHMGQIIEVIHVLLKFEPEMTLAWKPASLESPVDYKLALVHWDLKVVEIA